MYALNFPYSDDSGNINVDEDEEDENDDEEEDNRSSL